MTQPIPLSSTTMWTALMDHQAGFEAGSGRFRSSAELLRDYLDDNDERALMNFWTLPDLAKQARHAFDAWQGMDRHDQDNWRR